jgi:methylated-DNA-protein-cysteine methyltransferase-like protein
VNERWSKIYRAVRRIPRGRVATYGTIATLAGLDGHARQVGYALHALPPGLDIPWHRVVNAKGEISARSSGDSHELQRHLLEAEGVEFSLRGMIEMKRFAWKGPGKAERLKGLKAERVQPRKAGQGAVRAKKK